MFHIQQVAAVFSLARKLAPTIIFIDEVDCFLSARGGADGGNDSMLNMKVNEGGWVGVGRWSFRCFFFLEEEDEYVTSWRPPLVEHRKKDTFTERAIIQLDHIF